jgi:hypothetical protein
MPGNAGVEGSLSARAKETAIRADLREGKAGIMKLAAAHGVDVGTVQRISGALAG